MSQRQARIDITIVLAILLIVAAAVIRHSAPVKAASSHSNVTVENAIQKVEQGQQIFRFDTFGDEAFWGDTLKLHQAIEGAKLGGVGAGVSPATALAVGPESGRGRATQQPGASD
jgi:hypothetical protein